MHISFVLVHLQSVISRKIMPILFYANAICKYNIFCGLNLLRMCYNHMMMQKFHKHIKRYFEYKIREIMQYQNNEKKMLWFLYDKCLKTLCCIYYIVHTRCYSLMSNFHCPWLFFIWYFTLTSDLKFEHHMCIVFMYIIYHLTNLTNNF